MSKDQRKGRSPEDSADSKRDRPQPRSVTGLSKMRSVQRSASEGLPMHWPHGKCLVCQPEHMLHMIALKWCCHWHPQVPKFLGPACLDGNCQACQTANEHPTHPGSMVIVYVMSGGDNQCACNRVTTAAKSRKLNWHGLGKRRAHRYVWEYVKCLTSNWQLG